MFLKLLEKERTKRGWKQEDVAKRIGVARSTYANYEKGKREPDFDMSQKLADLFETTIDYLLGRETKEYSIEETEEDANKKELLSLVRENEDPHITKILLDAALQMRKK